MQGHMAADLIRTGEILAADGWDVAMILEVCAVLHELSGLPADEDCKMVDGRVVGWIVPDPSPGYERQSPV
jgi:hypothetical protein